MASLPDKATVLPADILRLIFDHHAGDYATLCAISLACRTWHELALPALYHTVDLSSHNLGRQPEHECSIMPVIYADFEGRYRPSDSRLVPRQRAFLRRIVACPDLAKYVQSFTWTLIWLDFDDEELQDIDRKTWEVFGWLNNVMSLDLASLHDVSFDEYVRANPKRLFPGVRELRLCGHMHRDLVSAIYTSLDPAKLHSLKLDYLQDDGALPDGSPMDVCFASENNAHCVAGGSFRWTQDLKDEVISEALAKKQESGKAFVFPGPMWFPCDIFASQPMDSLAHLQVKVIPYDSSLDLRSYLTTFDRVSRLLASTSLSLTSLVIIFSEPYHLSLEGLSQPNVCGTGRGRAKSQRAWVIRLAALFLEKMLAVLNEHSFPKLDNVRFEGFDVIETAPSTYLNMLRSDSTAAIDRSVRRVVRAAGCSRFPRAQLIGSSSIDHRQNFHGYECEMPSLEGLRHLLDDS